ncbi:flagellar biosynthesis regulator FlaF [Acidomonas methanolica]|uniref:Flagellin assembly protein n=1 Tax=Acidomonas methanolica NBRC 104435 TaxID=1231351 RepID=A0A023D380_ACIMT|nr:flagellar biosynthesis regulator FlaF [Acidomonas methanolica]MBU2654461.1 flagellar biosynthesis regulator FlaF [Acidomonas methanolica]MCQ9155568.1 flagellar biosynthesis regulator FlaF [Acidomonas methanolica]TCS28264.1 flagellar protein FlaF [Acidomonas methanolica]GAJ28602.1 flagellin assembly protein [Acidomonas methanolica NBRC 104435]GBQ45904.1 flagellar biosynthesis regulator FlaF [Acidomonas methanolica]
MFYGASYYQNQDGSGLSPRETELFAFRRINEQLEGASSGTSRRQALALNYRLWSLLLRAAGNRDNPLPETLRNDVIKLGTWVLVQSNQAMNTNSSLKPLIDINAEMIDGLSPTSPAPSRRAEHDGRTEKRVTMAVLT